MANGPYQPTLTSSPGDWTLAINYTSTAFSTPGDLAIDSQGNAWVLSTSGNSSTVSVLNSTSGITSTFPQTGGAFARLALDPYDDPWLTNSITSSVTELNSAGVRATLNPFSGAGIQGPNLLAFDGLGNRLGRQQRTNRQQAQRERSSPVAQQRLQHRRRKQPVGTCAGHLRQRLDRRQRH